MSNILKVTAVSGSPNAISRTTSVINEITQRIGLSDNVELHIVELSDIGKDLGIASSGSIPNALKNHIDAIENADFLIVASPVYRASYTGLLKHLFDLVHAESLFDTPVLLAATGGSERHALVIDHQLRPLFSFFQALTLPVGVYATEKDFEGYKIVNPEVLLRIDLAVKRAMPFFKSKKSN
ncbi:FMN reductase [Vreelandella nigrificans]|uniref:FMN reductase n=1 Tax=Vreelandella nigrificans TaxID=2042704 RepID=A0A2A4HKY4_9GAMM|nr:FMN reductase [Halomonas nigrificans]PCF95582.1 FMN reductase [Halomonas nigrificans]